jgi:Sec-independent protein translocase protein TatA
MKDLGQGVREFQNSLSSKKDSSQTQSSSSTPAKDDPWADYKKRKDPMDEFR